MKCIRLRDETGITICPNEKYLKSALAKYGMEACTPSTSLKVLKSEEPGDDDPLDAEAASTFRSATLTLLYMSNERTDMQSSVRDLCCRLKEPNAGDLRRLKKVLRYGRGTSGMCTHFPAASSKDRVLRVFSDSNWANDKDSRKSTSGAVIMCEGCRLHAHSRGQDAVALSSCEAELYAASEAVKEAVILQEMLLFIGCGEYRMELMMDASAAKNFLHRRGCGRMKHIDARCMWMQDLVAGGGLVIRKLPRVENVAAMLTHPPSASELERFVPKCGMKNEILEKYRDMTSKMRAGFKAVS